MGEQQQNIWEQPEPLESPGRVSLCRGRCWSGRSCSHRVMPSSYLPGLCFPRALSVLSATSGNLGRGHQCIKVGLAMVKDSPKATVFSSGFGYTSWDPQLQRQVEYLLCLMMKFSCSRAHATSWAYLLPSIGLCAHSVGPASCPAAFLCVGCWMQEYLGRTGAVHPALAIAEKL